jgi:two-component system nitrogen regulation response regulator GlnG
VVRRAALAVCAGDVPQLAALLPPDAVAPHPGQQPAGGMQAPAAGVPPRPARTRLDTLGEQDITAALESNGWQIKSAAQALGISRPSLYKLLQAHPRIRRIESD